MEISSREMETGSGRRREAERAALAMASWWEAMLDLELIDRLCKKGEAEMESRVVVEVVSNGGG